MKALIREFDRHGERWLLLVFYAFVVSVIFVEVVRRFVFQYSSIWGRGDGPLRVHLPGLDRRRRRGEGPCPYPDRHHLQVPAVQGGSRSCTCSGMW